MRYLLDANVLIALTHPEHEHHERARRWAGSIRASLAVCPVVEAALVRFMVRIGHSPAAITLLLERLSQAPHYLWVPDSISYGEVDLTAISGHHQVTDAYLVALARSHGAILVTLDVALHEAHPADSLLIP